MTDCRLSARFAMKIPCRGFALLFPQVLARGLLILLDNLGRDCIHDRGLTACDSPVKDYEQVRKQAGMFDHCCSSNLLVVVHPCVQSQLSPHCYPARPVGIRISEGRKFFSRLSAYWFCW